MTPGVAARGKRPQAVLDVTSLMNGIRGEVPASPAVTVILRKAAMTATSAHREPTGRAEKRRLARLPLPNCRLRLRDQQGSLLVVDASPGGIRFRPNGSAVSPGQSFAVDITRGDTLLVERLPVEVIWSNGETAGCRIVLGDDDRWQTALLDLLTDARHRELIECAPIGIFQSTPQWRYLSANTHLARMYGYDSVQELMDGVSDIRSQLFVNPGDGNTIDAALAQGTIDGMEFRHLRKDGSVIWVSLSARAVRDQSGTILRYEGFTSDITQHKHDEELRREIELMIQHDLRTPASNAIAIAKHLREDASLTKEQRELILLLEQSGQHMLDTLNSHLDIYKIETGKFQLTPQTFDCAVVVLKLLEALSQRALLERIDFKVQVTSQHQHPGFRCPCQGEPNLLRMALQHLLVNALEASPPGTPVTVTLSSGADCRIEVRNRGVVPVEIRDRFFDKFVTKGKTAGTGLGTYTAKLMIQAQGGEIAMRTSDKDGETAVTVRLPYGPFPHAISPADGL